MDAIAPSGRIAALACAGCFIVLGVTLGVTLIDVVGCDALGCQQEAAAAALLIMVAIAVVVLAVVVAVHVIKRPLDEEGESGWFWGLGIVFLMSAIAAAVLVPSATCPMGGAPDRTLEMCLSGHDRLPMSSWIWLEGVIVALGAACAVLLATWRRFVWVNVTITVSAFVGTFSWALVRHG